MHINLLKYKDNSHYCIEDKSGKRVQRDSDKMYTECKTERKLGYEQSINSRR